MSRSPQGVRCQPRVTAGLLRGVWGWGLVKDVAPTHTLRGTAGLQLGTDGPELASPCPRSGDMGTRGAAARQHPWGPWVGKEQCGALRLSPEAGRGFWSWERLQWAGDPCAPPHSLRG